MKREMKRKTSEQRLREKINNLEQKIRKLDKRINKQKRLIDIDFLTKLYNRQAFHKFFKNTYEGIRSANQRKNRRLQESRSSLLLINLDEFKRYNDDFGYTIGDQILKKVAKLLKRSVRNIDIVFRWGGDEFAIILIGTDISQAEGIAKIVLTKVKEIKIKKKIVLSVSIGVAQLESDISLSQIFEKADKALLEAKDRGRNQIVIG